MMANEHAEQWSIPVSRYPSPVCAFTTVEAEPVVQRVNEPFKTALGSVESDEPVTEAFERLGLTPVDSQGSTQSVATGDSFTVHTDDERYRVETVPPTGDDCGFLVFTELAGEEQFGVENVASVVSHDLRNPLDVAKSRLRAGREFDEDEHFEHVAQAHERMERIIQDVLTLARGEDIVDPDETVELDAVARDAWETVETGDRIFTVDGPLPTTVAGSDRVGRLFENLFRNSVEHGSTDSQPQADDSVEHSSTDSRTQSDDVVEHDSTGGKSETDQRTNGVSVTVGTLDNSSNEGFYVEDDGAGIPSSKRDRVFEPGYSSDDHGTGLGLAIVARIADLHGWSYTVTAGAEGGARIEIRGLDVVTD